MRTIRWLNIGAWIALVFSSLACREPHTITRSNAFFWEITGEKGTLFLLGSIHVLDVPIALGPNIEAAFLRSEELLVEINIRRISDEELMFRPTQWSRFAPLEKNLRGYLDDATYTQLEAYLAAHPPPERLIWDLEYTKPWMLSWWISLSVIQERELQSDYGVDEYFADRADGRIPITSLESMSIQLKAMNAVPLVHQATRLTKALRALDDGSENEEIDLIDAWKAGDRHGLAGVLLDESDPAEAAFLAELFFKRNESMSVKLGRYLDRTGIRFAVVGAGHLLGPRGIPSLLKASGFEVQRWGP